MWALSSWRHMSGGSTGRPGVARDRRTRPQVNSRSRFMERLEERWRRRQERDR
jgi:hypothetical protein